MTRLSSLPALLLLFSGGCADADDCARMCTAARSRFEGCLQESGSTWGTSVGYESALDYDNWCETFSWELRELGQADTCTDRLALVEAGNCTEYYDAWAVE